jgi:transposase
MITKTNQKAHEMSFIILETYVPENHLLRKIDQSIDFRFIYDLVEPLYSKIGRPSIDPIILFKLLFINHLYGYNSMRRTMEETKVNLAYRWFAGLGVDESVPHFSDFSKNYTRKFSQMIEVTHPLTGVLETKTVFAAVFEQILSQAVEKDYIQAAHIYMDSTHIKANANKRKTEEVFIVEERKAYQDALDQECDAYSEKKELALAKAVEPEVKRIKQSTVDPESGNFHKGEHEKQFAYLAQTVCDLNGFVLGVKLNPGNLHDSRTFLPAFDDVHQVFGEIIRSIGVDAGYKVPHIARELIERKITPLMPYTRPKGRKNNEGDLKVGKKKFVYDKSADVYHCPNGNLLTPRSVSKKDGYIIYRSSTKDCKVCPLKENCLTKSSATKTIQRPIWQPYLDEVELIRQTSYHAQYYPLRKQTIERIFADGKEKHGLRYTRYRGLKKVQDYMYLLFASMNMKKIALWSTRHQLNSFITYLFNLLYSLFPQRKTELEIQMNF